MRVILSAAVGLTFFAAACGGSSGGTTGTTGSAGGLLADGHACTSNASCQSNVCGPDGTGNCCSSACSTSDAACGATACDATGACTYPASGTSCAAAACSNGILTSGGTCNGSGTCAAGAQGPCPQNFACQSATACATTCSGNADCAGDFVCNGGACGSPVRVGSCTENDDCTSGICGLAGTGNCCTTTCASAADPACDPTSCDPGTGACVYPMGMSCGTSSCANGQATTSTCDATGTCNSGTNPCPNNFTCNTAGTACNTSCTATTDCVSGFFCVADAGACDAQITAGACTENDACLSDVCGIDGTGHCCTAACTVTTAPCGATDCDNTTAACSFPAAGTACGTILESCAANIQQNPSACDGAGNCNTSPGTTACTPYICGTNACLTSCTDNTSCGTGDFCDVANTACCTGLATGGTLAVDSTNGSDATACCGVGVNGPCQTLNQAMKLIDSAQAKNVTITATVAGAGGDWAPAKEVYPIALGWGAELSAAGVFFTDTKGNLAVVEIGFYSANDTVGYASIVGTANSQVSVGMDSLGDQSTDTSAIEVAASNTLYIANATVNGSATSLTAAITVAAGGTLLLAQDQSGGVTGTVTIGNNDADSTTDGYNGIVCLSAKGQGCTISDATLKAGASSVVIEGQEGVDIDAEDDSMITLTSAPVVGIAPKSAGFGNCLSKPDSSTAETEAILLNGSATMTFSNGTVQCISGDGFVLQAADKLASTPTLTLNGTTIQNTEYAVYATAGSASIQSSTIQYNYNGVLQGTDGTNLASVNLGGVGVSTNTVVCSNSAESIFGAGGANGISAVCVLNMTTNTLNADNVNWDTNNNASPPPDEPDLFTCSDATLTTCTCETSAGTCTNAGGVDGMDAVYTSTGSITQNDAGLSTASCTVTGGVGQACDGPGDPKCPVGDCCDGLSRKCIVGNQCPGG